MRPAAHRRRRAVLCFLLLVGCLFFSTVSASPKRNAVLSYDWGCAPDDDVQLDVESLWRAQRLPPSSPIAQSENEKLLSYLGLPFSISMMVGPGHLDRDCLIRLSSFMDQTHGVCPPYMSALSEPTVEHTMTPATSRVRYWQFYYYAFAPDALARNFGEARFAFLNRLRLPQEWTVAVHARAFGNRTSSYADEVTRAEARIAQMRISSPPGRIKFTFGLFMFAQSWDVSLADVSIALKVEELTSLLHLPPVTRTAVVAVMTADLSGVRTREQLLEGILSKRQYARSVAAFDEHLSRVRDEQTRPALERVIGDEMAQFFFETAQQENWAAYQRTKKEQTRATPDGPSRAASESRAHTEAWAGAMRSGACAHVEKAWETLRRAQWTVDGPVNDSRYRVLLRLAQRRRCTSAEKSLRAAAAATRNVQWRRPAYCTVVCDAVRHQRAWSSATNEPPTVAQNVALLTAAFLYSKAVHDGVVDFHEVHKDNKSSMTDLLDTTLSTTAEFDATRFLEFVGWEFQLMHCNADTETVNGCHIPRRVEAEMQYTQAMLELLRRPHVNRHHPKFHGATRTAALVQEAAWKGSMRATATLATMKEHGMWFRQQRKAAAALVMKSMLGAPNYLHLELLKARLAPHPQHHLQKEGGNSLSPYNLLRFERVFAVSNSWASVDNPFVTSETVKLMVAVEDVTSNEDSDGPTANNPYDELGGANGRITTRISSMLLRGLFHLTGFKEVRRSPEAAECKALAALRLLGYTCDMDVRRSIGRPIRRADMCSEHNIALTELEMDSQYPRVRCTLVPDQSSKEAARTDDTGDLFVRAYGRAQRGSRSGSRSNLNATRFVVVPNQEILFQHLQSALIFLSYFYLTHGQQYELAAAYAHLAVHAAANVHTSTMNHLASPGMQQVMTGKMNAVMSGSRTFDDILHGNLDWNVRWMVDRAAAQANVKSVVNESDALGQLPDVAHSPFLTGDHWTLLGLVSVPPPDDHRRRRPEAASDDRHKETLPVEQLLLRSTLSSVFGVRNSGEAVSDAKAQMLTSLVLFLKGASLWKVDEKLTNVLDHTIYAVHRTDPFVLASTLLATLQESQLLSRAPANAAPETAGHALWRHTASVDFFAILGDDNYLPGVHESDEAFGLRLLMEARGRIRQIDVSNVILETGMAPSHLTRQTSVLNDAPPHADRINSLRVSKQYTMEGSEFQPLLYAADLHHYQHKASQPWHWRVLDSLLNSVYYLFTETTEESLARRLGFNVLNDAATNTAVHGGASAHNQSAERSLSRSRSPAPFVGLFQDCFRLFDSVRQLTTATLLFSFAMEQGLPQGFALVFLEATDRANPFLQRVADYLATEVWPPNVVRSMFNEHQAVAQWQAEKPGVRTKRGTLLSLNYRSPFFYTKAENRQELMMRLSTWYAKHELRPRLVDPKTASSDKQEVLVRMTESLTMCASPLLHYLYTTLNHDLDAALHVPHLERCYDGMLFPAGAPECVLDLIAVAEGLHNVRDVSPLARLLQDLGQKRAVYYGLSPADSLRPDHLPSSAAELGDIAAASAGRETAASDDDSGSGQTPAKQVEPWRVTDDEHMRRTVDRGEGQFYNQRLHDVTGTRVTAAVLLWKARLGRLLSVFW